MKQVRTRVAMRNLSVACLVLLAACGTPAEQCIARNTRDLRTVESLIAEAEGNLRRGYAYRTETDYKTVYEACPVPVTSSGELGDDTPPPPPPPRPLLCPRLEERETRVPVAIDLQAEARKLTQLRDKRQSLLREAESVIAQCRAAYPE